MTLWRVGLAAAQMAAVPVLLCTDLLVGTARWAALAAVFVALAVANRLRARLTRRIAALNPAHDFEAIYKLLGCYEFPWEMYVCRGCRVVTAQSPSFPGAAVRIAWN